MRFTFRVITHRPRNISDRSERLTAIKNVNRLPEQTSDIMRPDGRGDADANDAEGELVDIGQDEASEE